MSRDDIQKLLGGYATGTLTPEEQRVLFEAALVDQDLFDALAREEALREVLSDPAARAQLLAAVDDAPAPWYRQWWRPALVLATALLVVVGVAVWQRAPAPPRRMAKLEFPPLPKAPESQSSPLLPPPPEIRRAAPPAFTPFTLPGATPVEPPPSPKAAAPAATAGGLALPPMQQAQQGQRSEQFGAHFAPVAGRAAPPEIDVPLHGVVTDTAGAAIKSATVNVKSVATGDAVTVSTDDRGEFHAPGAPGGAYEISASAPGFRPTSVNWVTPASGEPPPVNLRLDVGSPSQTVEVTAAAAPLQAVSAADSGAGRGGRGAPAGVQAAAAMSAGAMETKASTARTPPPLEYHLMQRMPAGDLVEVVEGGTVPAGAALILRVTPNANGSLRVLQSNGLTIANPRVQRGKAAEIALPPFGQPGRVELRLEFQRTSVTIAFNVQ
jgi:hypothetical protein